MNVDFARFAQRGQLESDAHPAVALVSSFIVTSCDGVCVDKKGRILATSWKETFLKEVPFMVEHLNEAFFGDVAFAFAIDFVAKLHVVGGHAFCDGS